MWTRQPYLRWMAVAILGGFILWRGLQPVLSGPETDFPNYYTASRLVLEGSDVSRSYDDVWFQEQMRRSGFHHSGKFSPFPPPTALVLVPLSWLDPVGAFRVLTLINMLAMVFCTVLLKRIAEIPWDGAALFVLAGGWGIINSLRFGQLYIILTMLLLAAFHYARDQRLLLAGILTGILIPVKYFPLILVLWFLWKKQWRPAGIAVLTAGAVTLVSLVVLGPGIFETFFSSVLPDHIRSRYSLQSPYAIAFQSWDSLLMRLFVPHPIENPAVMADSPAAYALVKAAILLAGGGLVAWQAVRAWHSRSRRSEELFLALLGIAALLFAPGTATYHFVLLWLPLALLYRHTGEFDAIRWIATGCYAAIGWIPYSWLHAFERAGGAATVLAYPRLLLLTALFFAAFTLLHRVTIRPALGEVVE